LKHDLPRAIEFAFGLRTRSSAVEHYVDIVGVTGSIPVVSTIKINGLVEKPKTFRNETRNETIH
jgi:hypothetical protein